MKFFGMILVLLFALNVFAADGAQYTDYEGGIRIENQGVTSDYGNPVKIAQKIKAESKADWVQVSLIRKSHNPLRRYAAIQSLNVPLTINFTIKKNDSFYSAICNAYYIYDDLEWTFGFVNEDCAWWTKLKTGKTLSLGSYFHAFDIGVFYTNNDSASMVTLDCQYATVLGWAHGNSAGRDYDSATTTQSERKLVYIDTRTDETVSLGLFTLEYKAADQQITLEETDPNDPVLKTRSNLDLATLKNNVFVRPEDRYIPSTQTKMLSVTRGPVAVADGQSLPYAISSSCTIVK